MVLQSFGEIIYQHFVSIYGNRMVYDESMVPFYEKMNINYFKLKRSGEKIFVSKNNQRETN